MSGLDAARDCEQAIRQARVGGAFWGAQPAVRDGLVLLARPTSVEQARSMYAGAIEAGVEDELLLWLPADVRATGMSIPGHVPLVQGDCDPWHLFDRVEWFWCDGDDEQALLGRIAGKRVRCFGAGRFAGLGADETVADDLSRAVGAYVLDGASYRDPFTGESIAASEMIELLGFWRRLVDANRPIRAAAGFAFWKRAAVAPLLWGGGDDVRFITPTAVSVGPVHDEGAVALWRSKVPANFVAELERSGVVVQDVEDGFIRSAGLGADCVPPLSIVVDGLGAHFDPASPSDLENILRNGEFPVALVQRAARLRERIVESGLSKYAATQMTMPRIGGARHHILVTGQVEDDRSVLCGGADVAGNLDLLRRVREHAPDAFIIYKPHPDIEAGHRKGHVPDVQALAYADRIIRDAPISALLDMVDGVHVLTSLAGFEALLRGKQVTTHGVPFYAGWGLTTDLGPVPARRNVARTLDELVAAVLLLYPRYLDPLTRLPCPPEILVRRLLAGGGINNNLVVTLRRAQGAAARLWARRGKRL